MRIDADPLIPGRGKPIADGTVVIEGSTIAHAGPRNGAPPSDQVVHVPAAMPGLWDCHGHYTGIVEPDLERGMLLHAATKAARATTDLAAICDGVPECLKAVRTQLRKGAEVIKVCASGGVLSEIDHPVHQQFSDEELRAIVEAAARAERAVAAHCHGKPGILAAVRARVTTIEHGSYLDDEVAEAMLDAGTILVPTRFVVAAGLDMEDSLPPYAYRKMVAIAHRHEQGLKTAIAAGVPIAMGTDIFISGDMFGANSREIQHLIDAGMTTLEAIETATPTWPTHARPSSPEVGTARDRLRRGRDRLRHRSAGRQQRVG